MKDILLQIAQTMGVLTADQEQIRANALKEMKVAPESVSVDYEALVGQGGFGMVYEGRYNGMPVAVKIISLKVNGAQKQKVIEISFSISSIIP